MKKIIFYSLSIVISYLSSCKEKTISETQVPQPTLAAFHAKYPGATDVEWKTETEDNKQIYEAQCTVSGKRMDAHFDATGNFIKEE
ncbi:MAG: hypothetical protein NVS1B13_21150 [Flavisolibacter sp.]